MHFLKQVSTSLRSEGECQYSVLRSTGWAKKIKVHILRLFFVFLFSMLAARLFLGFLSTSTRILLLVSVILLSYLSLLTG
jgi:hypothetical protein